MSSIRQAPVRVRFQVSLETSGEIDFKALAKSLQPTPSAEEPEEKEDDDADLVDLTEDDPLVPKSKALDADADTIRELPVPLSSSRGRFNIIERLEQRYGKGGLMDIKEKPKPRKNIDHDDLYDSEDSFIDDSDLHESIENTYQQSQIKTKHSGFFVNAGEKIETVKDTNKAVENADNSFESDNESPKKKGKRSLNEDNYIEDDWQPGPEVDAVVAKFKQAATEYFSQNSAPKLWPPALDDGLREVDKIVVNTHPQRWRVNGYMVHLMAFLPYTKSTLRNRMIMLEAKDNANEAKMRVETHFEAFKSLTAPLASKLEASELTPEQAKEAFMADSQIAISIYMALTAVDEWVTKENEYRPLLKQEDKKQLEEADTLALSTQRERNRLYNRLLACVPIGLNGIVDLACLRELFKIGKKGSGNKATTAHAAPVAKKAASATAKKIVKTPPKPPKVGKESPPVPGPAAAATADGPKPPPAKKPSKPLKSRRFEPCPIWSVADFQEKKDNLPQ